jgi:aspartyl-tRNA synthetase
MERTLTTDTIKYVSEEVTVKGWVESVRDHGQLLFIDLRDHSGKVQIVVDPEKVPDTFALAKTLGNEYVIAVTGKVTKRQSDLVNPKIATGEIEIMAEQLEVLNKSQPLPFPIDTDGTEIDEKMRLTYRYLDLRRPRMQKIMQQKHKLTLAVRNWMDQNGFTEVSTPLLTTTSPEGARDFIVPSRLHPGKFFVLPQAPQQFKQLLMVGGMNKYFQIAPCARDEDPRADRHYAIFGTAENLIKDTYKVVAPDKEIVQFPFPRIPHAVAIEKYGSDKPDIRFGLELQEITEVVKDKTEFNIFNTADTIKVIVVPGAGEWSRTQIVEMEDFAKSNGAKGLAYTKVTAEGCDTGIGKFLEPVAKEMITHINANPGDLLFFGAGQRSEVNKILGQVRSKLGEVLGLKDKSKLSFAWITDFPFYEIDDKTGKLDFAHNPFSMPQGGLAAFEVSDPLEVKTNQYDLALNGFEMLSGSIRNHDPEVLVKAFETVGYDCAEVIKRFGALYNAFQYGAPPHGGWAIGIDRLFMVLIDAENIRDTYAFPLNSSGVDLMMNAPSELPEQDLKQTGIDLRAEIRAKMK